MNKNYILWELLFIYYILSFHFADSELIFVYEHCRHGGRGPLANINSQNSSNNGIYYDRFNIPWKNGEVDLTLKGKIQLYILGIRNRLKYSNLINYTKYNPDELLIHSSKRNRAKKSAYSQLVGMFNPIINISKYDFKFIDNIPNKFYYPPNYLIWKNKTNDIYLNIINEAENSIKYILDKNITNIYSENDINKYILVPFKENRTFYLRDKCKNYKKYMEYNYQNKYNKLIEENFDKKYGKILYTFLKYDKKEYLNDIKNSTTLIDNYIVNYYEEIDLNYFYNFTKIDKEDFYKTSIIIYEWWLYNIIADNITCKIESSKIMEDLIVYMENKIKNNKMNMVIDFGDDITEGSMEYFMHLVFNVDYTLCHYGSNLFFELHKNNKNEYYVEYYIDEDLKLNISYNLFKKKIIENIWTDKQRDDFCFGNIILILHPKIYIILLFLVICLFIYTFGLFIYKYYKNYLKKQKKSKKNKDYDEDTEKKGNDKELDLI